MRAFITQYRRAFFPLNKPLIFNLTFAILLPVFFGFLIAGERRYSAQLNQKRVITRVMNNEEYKRWCKQNGMGYKRVGDLLDDFEEGRMDSEEFKRTVEVLKTEVK